MGKINLQKELTQSILDDEGVIKDMDYGSKEHFLATKAQTEKVKAVAELKKSTSELWGNIAKGAAAIGGVLFTAGTVFVEYYKARNKNETNKTIIQRQVNLMENWERNTYDNR